MIPRTEVCGGAGDISVRGTNIIFGHTSSSRKYFRVKFAIHDDIVLFYNTAGSITTTTTTTEIGPQQQRPSYLFLLLYTRTAPISTSTATADAVEATAATVRPSFRSWRLRAS